MLTKKQIELMKMYITEDEPFGPDNAAEITEPEALEILFDSHNRIYKALRKRPSIVIGRKGSGKTSYLHAAYFEKNYDYVVEIGTSTAFCNVIESIEKMTKGTLFPESIAELWETVLWIAFFNGVKDQPGIKSKKEINAYLAKVGVRDHTSVDDVFWTLLDTLSENAKGKTLGMVSDLLRRFDDISFAEVKEALCEEFRKKNQFAVIMLDSLDDFNLHIPSVALALQGLLKCIGRSNKPSAQTHIRFCLPAELFHIFQNISSNPNKDFRRELVLQWTAQELTLIAANRYLLYLQIYHPDTFHDIGIDVALNKDHARKVFEHAFPDNVVCKLGISEDPVAYVLRHTQLLPRHMLIILNAIWQRKRRLNGNNGSQKISVEAITQGVNCVEQRLVREIFVAFKAVYPNARETCEQCFPELQHVFSIGDLERVFRRHGKRAMETDDFYDFKRMLIEIGAVGRVVEESDENTTESDRYIQALFEYTVPHQLVTSTDDGLCLHPLFTEIFSAKTKLKKPVYPYGSMVDDADYRDWEYRDWE